MISLLPKCLDGADIPQMQSFLSDPGFFQSDLLEQFYEVPQPFNRMTGGTGGGMEAAADHLHHLLRAGGGGDDTGLGLGVS